MCRLSVANADAQLGDAIAIWARYDFGPLERSRACMMWCEKVINHVMCSVLLTWGDDFSESNLAI